MRKILIIILISCMTGVYALEDRPLDYKSAVGALLNDTAITDMFMCGMSIEDGLKAIATQSPHDVLYFNQQVAKVKALGLVAYLASINSYAEKDLKYLDSINNVNNLSKDEAAYRRLLEIATIKGKIIKDYKCGVSLANCKSRYDIKYKKMVEVIYKFMTLGERITYFRMRLELEDEMRTIGRLLHNDADYIWNDLNNG